MLNNLFIWKKVNILFFKKRNKVICFHEWKLAEYVTYVDMSLAIEEYYEIGCCKCNKLRTIDKYSYERMKNKGLIKKD